MISLVVEDLGCKEQPSFLCSTSICGVLTACLDQLDDKTAIICQYVEGEPAPETLRTTAVDYSGPHVVICTEDTVGPDRISREPAQ
ncbi:MAG: hypothetical protein ACYSUB_21920 [Planctomycetota bacterium]